MDTQIIAHRGASGLTEFDNSIESFQKAIDLGVDMIEFDVRKTKDGRLIAFHDPSIDGKKVCEIKYEEMLDISRKKGYDVPLLEDVLELCKGKLDLDIELKEEGYEEEVVDLVNRHLGYKRFLMKSFSDRTVKRIGEYDSDVRTGLLLGIGEPENKIRTRLSELFPKDRLRKCRADFVSPNYRLLKFFFLRRMRSLGMDVYVWTVNDEEMMKKLFKKKVRGIITDRPDIAIKIKERL